MTTGSDGSAREASPVDRSRTPPPGELRPFHFPGIHRAQLRNGIAVLVAEMHRLPVVSFGLQLPVGALGESTPQAGLASLAASLLESGAGERSAAEIADALEGLGARLDVGAGWDSTRASLTSLASRLPDASAVLAELVRAPTFPASEVQRLRGQQLAGIVQRRAEPRSLANEMATRFIFSPESPFSRPLSGTTSTVESLDREAVRAFHRRYYAPTGAAVLVAGDISPERALELADAGFGDWNGPVEDRIAAPAMPRFHEPRVVIVDRPGAVQSEVRAGHVGVQRSHPDYFPLLVMNAILGGAFSSRLNLNLRERHGFTYGIQSSFVMRREPGPFLISTAVQTEVTATALAEILREVRVLRQEPVTAAELDDARSYLAGVFPLRLQTTDGVLSRLSEMVLYDLPADYFDHYRERILSVTADEVLRVAQEHLQPERLVTVIVGDARRIRGELEGVGAGEVRVARSEEAQ